MNRLSKQKLGISIDDLERKRITLQIELNQTENPLSVAKQLGLEILRGKGNKL